MILSHLIIASIGAVIALRFKGAFHKTIAFGIAICVALPFLGNRITTTVAFILLGLFALLTSFYGVKAFGPTKTERVGIILSGLIIATSLLFQFQHWAYFGYVRVLMIVPILTFLLILMMNRRVTKEVSILLYWAYYALIAILPSF